MIAHMALPNADQIPKLPSAAWTRADASAEFAMAADRADKLGAIRQEFWVPSRVSVNGGVYASEDEAAVYLTGNSLGLQPLAARGLVVQELDDWGGLAVEAHLHGRDPWLRYHESLRGPLGRLVGAGEHEVVAMNTLTVNLHLLMLTFYRPTPQRSLIIIEDSAFPSDSYAVATQASMHGYNADAVVVRLKPRAGEQTLRTQDITGAIAEHGERIALVMLGGVNYLTGQFFDIGAITAAAHAVGARCGWDLAHAAGNVPLSLHAWNVDFAVWCSYKYLNSGPGAVAGAYVHERNCRDRSLKHLAGWWGNDEATRFEMGPDFVPVSSADRFAMSNPPILSLAPVKASLAIFDRVGMDALRRKSLALTGYLEGLLSALVPEIEVLTPRDPLARGCQLSLRLPGGGMENKGVIAALKRAGIICDFREPDIVRAAPVPLYTSFQDVHRFVEVLARLLAGASKAL